MPDLLAGCPGSRRTREVQERDTRTDTAVSPGETEPCRVWPPATSTWSRGYRARWTHRALPALEPVQPSNIPWGRGEKKHPHLFLSTHNLIKLHQYVTIPVLIYLVWFRELNLGTTQPLGSCQRRDRGDWQPCGPDTGQGPKPQASGLLKGAGSGPVAG